MSRGVYHIIQRSNDWGVVFYTDADRLVYFTQFAVKAKALKVRVVAFSIMFNHTHQALIAPTPQAISEYVQLASSAFGRAYNCEYGRHGLVFHPKFSRSLKNTDKAVRSVLAYVFNNHVEKRICRHAADCRWSFLAYARSDNPFSEPVDMSVASRKLRRVMRLAARRAAAGKPLTYGHIKLMFEGLDETETEQLKDYIISTYNFIDYSEALRRFGSYEKMVLAFDSTIGCDYDIHEEFTSAPDTRYVDMIKIGRLRGWLPEIYVMPDEEKKKIAIELAMDTLATQRQIRGFLHQTTDKPVI